MSQIMEVPCTAELITEVPGLDAIHVFWMGGYSLGQGYVTTICYGAAWTAYFGSMGGLTIRQFVEQADVDYLVTKLKATKRDLAYLRKIVVAVQSAIRLGRKEEKEGDCAKS